MSHPEFTITIKIKGTTPSPNELRLIRKFDYDTTEISASELKRRLQESRTHKIGGLVKPYVDDVLIELKENDIEHTVS